MNTSVVRNKPLVRDPDTQYYVTIYLFLLSLEEWKGLLEAKACLYV